MNGINPAVPAGASSAAFARDGGSLHAPRMAREVAAVAAGGQVATERVARSGFPWPRAQVSEMSPDALVLAANQRLSQETIHLEFIVQHDPAGVIVRLIDSQSGEVIRQYSTVKVLEYAVSGSVKPGILFYDAA